MKLLKEEIFLLNHKYDFYNSLPVWPWSYTNFGDHFCLFFSHDQSKMGLLDSILLEDKLK